MRVRKISGNSGQAMENTRAKCLSAHIAGRRLRYNLIVRPMVKRKNYDWHPCPACKRYKLRWASKGTVAICYGCGHVIQDALYRDITERLIRMRI
jgi:hypothetical protein